MKVRKTEIRVIVLTEGDEPFEFENLSQVDHLISVGDGIGTYWVEAIDLIEGKENVEKELIAVGNDGTFFDTDMFDCPVTKLDCTTPEQCGNGCLKERNT